MIIAIIISLIMGVQDFLLIPNMDKHARKHVESKEVAHSIKEIVKELSKKQKEFNKEQGDNWKKLEGIKSTAIDEYPIIIEDLKKTRKALLQLQIEARREIADMLTEEEWDNIYLSASKDFEKYKKRANKTFEKLDKRFSKLEKSISKEIEPELRKDELLSITSRFKEQLYGGIKKQYELYFNNPELWKYEANAQTINETTSRANEIRMAYLDSFVESRIQIIEFTTEKEREKIIRRLNKLF
jgi:hypothetical protein